jgi:hypothetical protein
MLARTKSPNKWLCIPAPITTTTTTTPTAAYHTGGFSGIIHLIQLMAGAQ